MKNIFLFLLLLSNICLFAQDYAKRVNVFLGTSGDHGQLSPAASSPFAQLSIALQTYPTLHAGYEYLAKEVIGFTHNRMEGTGCKGSGGLILFQPFIGNEVNKLTKTSENAGPGFYEIALKENIQAKFAVDGNVGIHEYTFPKGDKGIKIVLDHAFNNAFVDNQYEITKDNILLGKVRSKTTCNAGIYTIYYAIQLPKGKIQKDNNHITITLPQADQNININIAFSAVDTNYALATLQNNLDKSYAQIKNNANSNWNKHLSSIEVDGDEELKDLFYSLYYRTMQSPFLISEKDKKHRGTDGKIHSATCNRYHGWAIWDNYKTQLPLVALTHSHYYQDMISSISDLYKYGKYDFAGPNDPANSVRTEHAAVLLLDGMKKGFKVDVATIRDSLIKDTSRFDFTKPDKYLEATYDMWAMSHLFPNEKEHYLKRAQTYKTTWNKEFKDLTKRDVDRMSARGMYQGTIRQYRWNVPYDLVGLTALIGGKQELANQLDDFFDNHYFNRANEPDLQSPTLYYASNKPWRYQSLVHELAVDTVIQYYFNDNSRGIDPFIDRIYKNQAKAFVRTMDDDAGAMSGWFVLTAIGLQQPLIGEPIYYLNVPLFKNIKINNNDSLFEINVSNFDKLNRYIHKVTLNGKDINRLWLNHNEIVKGGKLEITAGREPSNYGENTMWISELQ